MKVMWLLDPYSDDDDDDDDMKKKKKKKKCWIVEFKLMVIW